MSLSSCARNFEQFCGFLQRAACKKSQLYHLGLFRVLDFEFSERFVQGQQIDLIVVGAIGEIRNINAMDVAATFLARLAAGVIDENPSYRLGGGCKEMASAVPVLFAVAIHQPQIRLVYQGSGLQRLPRLLLGELLSGQLSQLGIHQWQQIRSRLWIAMTNGIKYLRYLGHEVHNNAAAFIPPRGAPCR